LLVTVIVVAEAPLSPLALLNCSQDAAELLILHALFASMVISSDVPPSYSKETVVAETDNCGSSSFFEQETENPVMISSSTIL
jgi:hypothetical protein